MRSGQVVGVINDKVRFGFVAPDSIACERAPGQTVFTLRMTVKKEHLDRPVEFDFFAFVPAHLCAAVGRIGMNDKIKVQGMLQSVAMDENVPTHLLFDCDALALIEKITEPVNRNCNLFGLQWCSEKSTAFQPKDQPAAVPQNDSSQHARTTQAGGTQSLPQAGLAVNVQRGSSLTAGTSAGLDAEELERIKRDVQARVTRQLCGDGSAQGQDKPRQAPRRCVADLISQEPSHVRRSKEILEARNRELEEFDLANAAREKMLTAEKLEQVGVSPSAVL